MIFQQRALIFYKAAAIAVLAVLHVFNMASMQYVIFGGGGWLLTRFFRMYVMAVFTYALPITVFFWYTEYRLLKAFWHACGPRVLGLYAMAVTAVLMFGYIGGGLGICALTEKGVSGILALPSEFIQDCCSCLKAPDR